MSNLLSVNQAAALLNRSNTWVYRAMKRRELPFIKVGGGYRFRREDIETYIEDQFVEASKEAIK